ncbi:MAG: hypothetical protein CMH31_02380 [Micavibrio sp.]|nr:hypothetical protein [Micavibrio sp.]|tara:strand:- start:1006 stop:1335 length:330 start_codon:yes stop_codon:yes gene_type:complete
MEMLDEKQEKQAKKIFYRTANIGGIGVGMFILSLIAPLINNVGITGDFQALFVKYGLICIGYVVLMIVFFVFMRKQIMALNIFMQWIVLPTIAILFAMDAYGLFTGSDG